MGLNKDICELFKSGDACLKMRGHKDWDNPKTQQIFDFIGIGLDKRKQDGFFYVYSGFLHRRLYSSINTDKQLCIDDFFYEQTHEVAYISISEEEHHRLLEIEKKYNEILKIIA